MLCCDNVVRKIKYMFVVINITKNVKNIDGKNLSDLLGSLQNIVIILLEM